MKLVLRLRSSEKPPHSAQDGGIFTLTHTLALPQGKCVLAASARVVPRSPDSFREAGDLYHSCKQISGVGITQLLADINFSSEH